MAGREDKHRQFAEILFAEADRGFKTLLLPDLILAESVYVFDKVLRLPRSEITTALVPILQHTHIECAQEVLVDALRLFESSKVDFADCYLAATSQREELPVASLDRDFAKLKPFEWLKP